MGEQGRIDRYGLYDHTKNMLATPPDMLRINEKYLREYYIVNCFGMVITTNHRDALYLPADDRRHYLAFSERRTEDFDATFWNDFWNWYKNEDGLKHVVALLHQYDLTNFDPKAAPRKTPAFWLMVETDRGEPHGELADAIDALGNPKALTINQLMVQAPGLEWLRDLKMRRIVRKRLDDSGYVPVINDDAKSGLRIINKKRQMIYARSDLGLQQRLDAARELQAATTGSQKSVQ